MKQVMAVAAGGAMGSVLRYVAQKNLNASFPIGTLIVNITGCFLAGILWALLAKASNDTLSLLLMTGFCGGFTTLSAFSVDGVQMLTTGCWLAFFLYTTGSIAGGMLATFFGYKIFT